MGPGTLDELAAALGTTLKSRGLKIATAESCTGGWVGQAITSVSGSSEWYDRGFICYSNASKHEMLGVPGEILDRFGAVSEETVRAMAVGALAHSRAQTALAVSGVAGPSGGTRDKPVGTVCLGWALPDGSVVSETRFFPGDRQAVRRRSVETALARLIDSLTNGKP
jgi:nicotinamide-nucleotide amidase